MSLYDSSYAANGGRDLLFRRTLNNRKLMELLEPSADDRILDVGCNGGALVEELREFCNNVVGIDVNEDAVNGADIEGLHVMDATDMEFPDSSFNKVASVHVIEHIKDIDRMFGEMKRVLEPGGKCVLIYPFELVRGLNALHDAVLVYKDPFKCRDLHVHKLNPDKIDKMTSMELVDSGLFMSPFPTYYTVLENT